MAANSVTRSTSSSVEVQLTICTRKSSEDSSHTDVRGWQSADGAHSPLTAPHAGGVGGAGSGEGVGESLKPGGNTMGVGNGVGGDGASVVGAGVRGIVLEPARQLENHNSLPLLGVVV